MRGSVYYQTGLLAKAVFHEGAKKHQKADPTHRYYDCVSSYKTMQTYRKVWDNLGNYLKEHWGLKDMEKITAEHIDAYISYKIEYYPSKQYLEKIVSALGKLEWALILWSSKIHGTYISYDFDIRKHLLHYAKVQHLVADGYHNRTYEDPERVIHNLTCEDHKIAAHIQAYGGARSEAVTLIKPEQLMGIDKDPITGEEVGYLLTKEKGGKEGNVMVHSGLYRNFEHYLQKRKVFRISYAAYAEDIRLTCQDLGITPHGSHGFRWYFAKTRVREYQKAGYSYEQALQGVSWEMKHFRKDITEHYLGG